MVEAEVIAVTVSDHCGNLRLNPMLQSRLIVPKLVGYNIFNFQASSERVA